MKIKNVLAAILGFIMMTASPLAAAKRTAEEQAIKDAGKASAKASRVRLQAKFDLDETIADEALALDEETGRELAIKFRSEKGRIRLDVKAENFPEGTQIEAFVDDVSVGILDVQLNEAGQFEGELSFRDAASWPAGLPMALTAGTSVTFIDADGVELASGTLEAK